MDYSPYQRRSRRAVSQGKPLSIGVFLISAFVGFLLFWGIKSFFFTENGGISSVSYIAHSSAAEAMIKEGTSWKNFGTGLIVANGDKIRSKRGNTGTLIFENDTTLTLGLGSEVKMGEVRKTEENSLFGEVYISKGPVLADIKGFFSDEELKFWLTQNIYMKASRGKVLFDDAGVAVIEGEQFTFYQVEADGKQRDTKTIGIGQYLDLKKFRLQVIPESVKKNELVSSTFSPVAADPLPNITLSESDLKKPTILSPASNGEIIEITKIPQTIQGIAPGDAEKIVVAAFPAKGDPDEYVLKDFSRGDKKWKYVASSQYDNLAEGKNTYKIYAEYKDGKRSDPVVLVIRYTKDGETAQVFHDSKGEVKITAPSEKETAIQSTPVIYLKGAAPKNATYIVVVNKTLGTTYTLKKFRKGYATWNYQTGKLDPKSYSFLVKALDEKKRFLSSDSITVTVKKSIATPIATPLPKTTSGVTPRSTPVPTSTPLASPRSVSSSSSEAGR